MTQSNATHARAGVIARAPVVVMLVAGSFLVLSWLLVLGIDVFDVGGIRGPLFVDRESEYPYIFQHLFGEGGPVEWLQWLLLVLAAVTVAFCAGAWGARAQGGSPWGMVLLALGLGVLAVKDAGNPRHVASDLAFGIAGERVATMVELAIFSAVGLLVVAGLFAAWGQIRVHGEARRLFLAGYGAYAAAAIMSATSDLWYREAGATLAVRLFSERLLPPPSDWEPGLRSWLIMDSLVEESVELVAASLMAAAALLLLRAIMLGGSVRRPDRLTLSRRE